MFNSIVFSLISVALLSALVIFKSWKLISVGYNQLGRLIQKYSAMAKLSPLEVMHVVPRVLLRNWYSVIMLIALWAVLFQLDVGSDMVVGYIDNLGSYGFFMRIGSLWGLFGCILLMTLAIWCIPFFLFAEGRAGQDNAGIRRFYIGTKLLSMLAIIPFYIIASAFYFRDQPKNIPFWYVFALISAAIIAFLWFELWILQINVIKNVLNKAAEKLAAWGEHYLAGNRYIIILIKVLIFEMVFIFIAVIFTEFIDGVQLHHLVSIFVLVSSATVFRLLFFTDEKKLDEQGVITLVKEMIGTANRIASRRFYWLIIVVLVLVNGYYFFVPSLSATNTIYVVLIVFAMLIIYLDFFRNLTAAARLGYRIVGYTGILIFLIAPFVAPKHQFSVPLRNYEGQSSGSYEKGNAVKMGLKGIDSLRLMENALIRRIEYIRKNRKDSSENFYVVCAMGGGSRAGYFTVRVLQALEAQIPCFWDNTLMYSTISGGSVGTYHYIKTQTRKNKVDAHYLKHIYLQNYNTSAAFGLLLADSFEGAFGGLIGKIRGLISGTATTPPYRDRNVRIREEYEYALQAALAGEPDSGYFSTTFRRHVDIGNPDAFQGFFSRQADSIPIHFVNTFEVSTGRRTILSPFIVGDSTIFPNAIMPLQDPGFSKNIINKDITYREAVNLSELFPFLSAASTIGDSSEYQFVDGGYFENYGLATAFDVVESVLRRRPDLSPYIKIILIQNSLQKSKIEKKKRQLIAPLVGVINAPFTGHANHFKEYGQTHYGERLLVLEFDSDKADSKVPLTRALTQAHLRIMDTVAIAETKRKIDTCRRRPDHWGLVSEK